MARRRGPKAPAEKSALGLNTRSACIKRLTEMRDAKIATMVDFGVTTRDVVDILIPASVQDILRRARGVVEEGGASSRRYAVAPGVHLRVADEVWQTLGLALPSENAINIDYSHPKVASFLQGINAAQEIIDEHTVAATMLSWMDCHMGRGTLRYYFPAVLSLLPDENKFDQELVERTVEPMGMGPRLPAIRRSAALIAANLLLPDPPAKDGKLRLVFGGGEGFVQDSIHYARDTVYINI